MYFLGGRGGRCVRLTTLPLSCAVVMKAGNLNFLEPSGPLQACNGTDLAYLTVDMTMHLLYNIQLNVPVTQDHYEASIKNFIRVRHEVQIHTLQNYQNRTKKCTFDKFIRICIRKRVQTVARNTFGKPTGRPF